MQCKAISNHCPFPVMQKQLRSPQRIITSDLSTFAPIDLIIRWEAEYFYMQNRGGIGNRDKSVSLLGK